MRVLVGCECSSTVTSAFRAKGVEAFSCDIQPCYGNLPEYHIQGDLREVYNYINPDLFIAHPPCTFLSSAGYCRLYPSSGCMDMLRYEKGLIARDFFLWCLSRPAAMVCVENPQPMTEFKLPLPSQVIQPFYFGEPYYKRTFLWLRNLPPLVWSSLVRPVAHWTHVHKSSKVRSKTFPGIAAAMADCWSGDLVGLQYSLF